ncbi:hypothetical protein E2C01_036591 [Portunus trituberculatus]|uniref:Uncharacterized protein n=1 Tax=Portunus trituberculatus TaxID=210409 RepID=A0A5B7FCD3_PORTR|nr:hypothetical protein [Portunus trituberculatus]
MALLERVFCASLSFASLPHRPTPSTPAAGVQGTGGARNAAAAFSLDRENISSSFEKGVLHEYL